MDNSSDGFTYDNGSWDDGVDIDPDGSTPTSVSCASDTFCVAMDNFGKALTDNSGNWQPVGVDGQRYLTAVSCLTTTLCLATDSSGNVLTDNSGTWTSAAPLTRALRSNPSRVPPPAAVPPSATTAGPSPIRAAPGPALPPSMTVTS